MSVILRPCKIINCWRNDVSCLTAGWPERTGWRLGWALRSLGLLPWGCCQNPDRPRAKIRGTQLSETKDRP